MNMKISSKSILSPGHSEKSRERTLSFSSSLNRRRLRPNGSSISSSSPMFPTGTRKRGCFFDTPEPSSPKVTCIGQVRVNTKKKHGKKKKKKMVAATNGDVLSFREAATDHNNHGGGGGRVHCLPQRNPKWVHLPFTICEALRSFGADFSCFLPCGGRSCSSSMGERDNKGEKIRGTLPSSRSSTTTTTASSCGAIFAKWLMALHEGDDRMEEKRREVEMVVGEEEERESKFVVNVMDFEEDDDYDDEKGEAAAEEEEEEEEEIEENGEARVSICIPPRNALLLMRCRSDPLRMSALANRFWDSPVTKDYEDGDEDSEDDSEVEEEEDDEDEESGDDFEVEEEEEEMNPEVDENCGLDEETLEEEVEQEQVDSVKVGQPQEEDEEVMVNGLSPEALEDQSVEGETKLGEVVVVAVVAEVEEEEEQQEQVVVDDNGNEVSVNGGSLEDHLQNPRLEEPELQSRVIFAGQDVDDEEEELVDEMGVIVTGVSFEALENPRLEEPDLQERVIVTDEDEAAMVGSNERGVLEDVSSVEAEVHPSLADATTLLEIDELMVGRASEVDILKSPEPPLAEQVAILVLEEIIERLVEDGENEEDEVVEKNDDKYAQVTETESKQEGVVVVVVEQTDGDEGDEEEAIHELELDEEKSEERASHVQLPDCLLLMLYEPKLSMEVSKETWVCRTDFITRSRPREIVLNNDRRDNNRSCKKNLFSTTSDSNAAASEFTAAPPPPSMASMIKQKFVNAVGYEPLVLTRCKSEPPLRSSSPAKLGF